MAHNLTGSPEACTHHLATAAEVTAWRKQRLDRRDDPRIHRLHDILCCLPKPDVVVFEDVQFQSYTLQCQLWSSFRTVVWLTFGTRCLLECVPVSTLKVFATRYGKATKEQMAEWLWKANPELKTAGLDDNAIDAIWLFKWAQTHLSRAKI